jgi:hypothetical protein
MLHTFIPAGSVAFLIFLAVTSLGANVALQIDMQMLSLQE